jgi:hypothetical protein
MAGFGMENVMNMYGPQAGPAVQRPQAFDQPQQNMLAQVMQMLAQGREPGKQLLGHAAGTQRNMDGSVRDFNAPTGINWLKDPANNNTGGHSWEVPGSTQGQWNGPRDAQAFNRAQVPHAVVQNGGNTYTPFGEVGNDYGGATKPATFDGMPAEAFFNNYGLPHEGKGTPAFRAALSPEERQLDADWFGYKMPQPAPNAGFMGPNYFNALDNEEQIRSNTGDGMPQAAPRSTPMVPPMQLPSNPLANVSPSVAPQNNDSVMQYSPLYQGDMPPQNDYVPGNSGKGGLDMQAFLRDLIKFGNVLSPRR